MLKPIASGGRLALSVPRLSVALHAEFTSSDAGPCKTTCAPQSKVTSANPRVNSMCCPLRRRPPSGTPDVLSDQSHSLEPVRRATNSLSLTVAGAAAIGAAGTTACFGRPIHSTSPTEAASAIKPNIHRQGRYVSAAAGAAGSGASVCISPA